MTSALPLQETFSARCLICGQSLGESTQSCDHCHTPYHLDCWSYNTGCAVFGCVRPPAPPAADEGGVIELVVPRNPPSLRNRSSIPDNVLPTLTGLTLHTSQLARVEQEWIHLGSGVGLAAGIAWCGVLASSIPLLAMGIVGLVISWPAALASTLRAPGFSALLELRKNGGASPLALATFNLALLMVNASCSSVRLPPLHLEATGTLALLTLTGFLMLDPAIRQRGMPRARFLVLVLLYAWAAVGNLQWLLL